MFFFFTCVVPVAGPVDGGNSVFSHFFVMVGPAVPCEMCHRIYSYITTPLYQEESRTISTHFPFLLIFLFTSAFYKKCFILRNQLYWKFVHLMTYLFLPTAKSQANSIFPDFIVLVGTERVKFFQALLQIVLEIQRRPGVGHTYILEERKHTMENGELIVK